MITPALMTGAFADRFRFKPYLIFILLWLLRPGWRSYRYDMMYIYMPYNLLILSETVLSESTFCSQIDDLNVW